MTKPKTNPKKRHYSEKPPNPITPEEKAAQRGSVNLGANQYDGPPYRQVDPCVRCREQIIWYWYDLEALRVDKKPRRVAPDRKFLCYKCKANKWKMLQIYKSSSNWWKNRMNSHESH